jgi:hypothetical protein
MKINFILSTLILMSAVTTYSQKSLFNEQKAKALIKRMTLEEKLDR